MQIKGSPKRLPRIISDGRRQRAAVGSAIAREPSVFLFDEPLVNLNAAPVAG